MIFHSILYNVYLLNGRQTTLIYKKYSYTFYYYPTMFYLAFFVFFLFKEQS